MRAAAWLSEAAGYVLPLLAGLCGVIMLAGRRDPFRTYTEGAREGLKTAAGLLPSLTAMLGAVAMLSASGAPEMAEKWLSPLLSSVGIPVELTPLLVTRPFSGSASLAVLEELLTSCGPDSFPALCGCVLCASSDTTVYVLSLYFSSVGLRRTRYALPCALAVMVFCILLSCIVCRMLF